MNNMVKTPEELVKILKASAMGDMCFNHILDFIKVGMTELKVAEEIERVLTDMGGEGLSFPTICVSGVRTELPHGEPSDKKIEEGDFVTMDFGAIVDGYCGDMTRTVAMGYVTKEQEKVYETVLTSQLSALAAVKAGVHCSMVDKVARDVIVQAGYGEYYIHGTGHGVGTEVHEAPTLNAKSEEILEEYMPVTVEPGIYIPGRFGVRIEDLAFVTNFGIINTNKSEKELIII
ncbi:MAG: M24 family metallopeptidase [Anaerovoracaceae bacterium]